MLLYNHVQASAVTPCNRLSTQLHNSPVKQPLGPHGAAVPLEPWDAALTAKLDKAVVNADLMHFTVTADHGNATADYSLLLLLSAVVPSLPASVRIG